MSVFDLSNCTLCPRECGVNRTAGQRGFCGEGAKLRAARAALLYYEEPCISGTQGSGAVFFTGCSLGCIFCQNAEISGSRPPFHVADDRTGQSFKVTAACGSMPSASDDISASGPLDRSAASPGREITPSRLADIFFELEAQGAANINLVTASHFLPLVIPALEAAKARGLSIPIVYNTSAYEKPEALRALDGLIDIYLPDYKFRSADLARRWAAAPDYPERAEAALAEMVRQQPAPLFADGSAALDEEDDRDIPLMKRGVIVRHLVMPGRTEDSKDILRYLHRTYGDRIFVSIMNQYTPMPRCAADPILSRPVTPKAYDEVIDFAIRLGIENGFIQEGATISRSFIPAWDGTGVEHTAGSG